MRRKFLLWLASWGKSNIYIWIEPVIGKSLIGSCGRVVFLNSPLRSLRDELFDGFAPLRSLSGKLKRPVVLLAGPPKGDICGAPHYRWMGDIRPESTDEELKKLAGKADREADRGILFPWGNPNLPWDKIPRFY